MKEIQAEGLRFVYLTMEDGLPAGEVEGNRVRDFPLLNSIWDSIIWEKFDDIRLILLNYRFQPELLYIYFLHWDDGTDLDGLDRKVAEGIYTSEDFQHSVITSLGTTKCSQCGWEGYTLVFFTSEAYIAKPELEQKKVELRHKSQGFLKCPNCDTKFRQMVVKVFLERT